MPRLVVRGYGSRATWVPAPPVGGNSDLVAALIHIWSNTQALVAISPQLYFDEAPEETPPPYCVLSQVSSRDDTRNTGVGFREQLLLQFAIYTAGKAPGAAAAATMVGLLDTLQTAKPTFHDGYLMGWFHASRRQLKMPGRSKGGLQIWQHAHIYRASIGHTRAT